jgi:hypothetical protein
MLRIANRTIITLLVVANALIATRAHAEWSGSNHYKDRWGQSVNFSVYNTVDSNQENINAARDGLNEWHNDTTANLNYTWTGEIKVYDQNVNNPNLYGGFIAERDSTGHFVGGRAYMDEANNNDLDYYKTRAVFCQEVGHAFGFDHEDQGCMGATYIWNGQLSWKWDVNQHNIDNMYSLYIRNHH